MDLLTVAFAVCWAIVFGYVLFLFNKQKSLQREIRALKEARKEHITE
ncbi:CcmD family protein [Chloroflexota bacterium]